MNVFDGGWWTIQVPNNWETSESCGVVTLSEPKKKTAVQVSTAMKEAGIVTDDELIEFADGHFEAAKLNRLSTRHFQGFWGERSDGEFAFRECWLRHEQFVIFFTLTSSTAIDDRKDSLFWELINSLTVRCIL